MTIRPFPTLEDIKQLAAELGVTFTPNRDSFDLDKGTQFEVHGTYRNNQAGINAAFSVLVRLQHSTVQYSTTRKEVLMDRQQMSQIVDDLNQRDEVDNARIVEFLGESHVHIDYTNGNIGTISKDDEYTVIPVKQQGKE